MLSRTLAAGLALVAALLRAADGTRLNRVPLLEQLSADAPPVRPLFGGLGEQCSAAAGHCVTVTDSYGIPRAAYLEGRDLSPADAAVALLQDQYAVALHINGTRVTAQNVGALAGVEPVVTVDGVPAAPEALRGSQAAGRNVVVRWRPAAGFRGAVAQPAALSQLVGRVATDADGLWFGKITDFIKNTTSTIVSVVTKPELLSSFINTIVDLIKNLADFFGCLQDLPDKYRLTGIASVVKLFVTDPTAALRKVFDDWVGAPLANLQGFVSGEMKKEGRTPVTVKLGSSTSNRKCMLQESAGSLSCAADAGDRGIRIKGGSGSETFKIEVEDHATVCATRTDAESGWTMDLWVECHETLLSFPVVVGRSTDKLKCVSVDAYNPICANHSASKSARLNTDKTDAKFKVTMDRRYWTGAIRNDKVCVERTDVAGGWEENLVLECHATAMAYDFSSIVDGSWKELLIQKAWMRLNDLVSMPHMEIGQCVTTHVLMPLKGPSHDFALLILEFVDTQVRAFLASIPGLLAQALGGLQEDLDRAMQAAAGAASKWAGSAASGAAGTAKDWADYYGVTGGTATDAASTAAATANGAAGTVRDWADYYGLTAAAGGGAPATAQAEASLLQEASRRAATLDLTSLGVDFSGVREVASDAVHDACMSSVQGMLADGTSLLATNATKDVFKITYAPKVVYRVAKYIMQQINDYVLKDIFTPLSGSMQQLIISAGNDMLLLLEGVCGIIPEVGSLLCETLTTPLADGLAWIQQAIQAEAWRFSESQIEAMLQKLTAVLEGSAAAAAAAASAAATAAAAGGQAAVKVVTAGQFWAGSFALPDAPTISSAVQQGMDAVPWAGVLVDQVSAHSALDKAFKTALSLAQQVFMMIIPDVNEYFADCDAVREALLPETAIQE